MSVIAVLYERQFSVVDQLQQLAEREEHEQLIYNLIMSAILIASAHF